MGKDERFPGVEWICDVCGESLSEQEDFDDSKYIWRCTNCGFKNSISKANIFPTEEIFQAFKNIFKKDE